MTETPVSTRKEVFRQNHPRLSRLVDKALFRHETGRTRKTVNDILTEARAKLPVRLTPEEAFKQTLSKEALIVDIRYLEQRMRDGDIPGAVLVHRNEFEWRCDPSSPFRDTHIQQDDYEQRIIVLCNQGYQSSLAAAQLQEFGMKNATDISGGFEAWNEAGLPIIPYQNKSS